MSWLSKLRNALHPRKLDEELLDEVRDHIERRTAVLSERGLSPSDARIQASTVFGNVTQLREQSRDIRMFSAIESAFQDARYAWRGMLKSPVFSATAVLSLGFAIGSITAIYSVIDAAMLRPLPVPAPERLFTLSASDTEQPVTKTSGERQSFSYPLFLQFRAAAADLARLALFSPTDRVEAQGPDETPHLEKIVQQYVSGEAFEILRVPPACGRVFSSADDKGAGQHPEAVLSHDYWRRRFHSNPAIVGRNIRVENRIYEVIGVAREGFFGVEPGKFVDVWLPVMMFDPGVFVNPAINWSRVMGRLAPHTTLNQLQARLRPSFHDDREEAIKRDPSTSPEIKNQLHRMVLRVNSGAAGFSSFRRVFGRPLWIVLAVAAGILLIACANVASLLLARATARSGEMAMRVSLGASPSRLVRQLLTESLLLSAIASSLGFAIASVAAPALVRLISNPNDPLRLLLSTDARVLLFCAGVCTLSALFFGLLPACRAAGVQPMRSLRREQAQASRLRMGRFFVSVQVAFAFCLIVAGASFLFTLHNLFAVNIGFDPVGVSVLSISSNYAAQQSFLTLPQTQELRRRIGALADVSGAAVAWWAIFEGNHRTDRVTIPGRPPSEREEIFYRISPGYFATLKIPLLEGRDLTAYDSEGLPLVPAIVNRAFADRYFGDRAVVGKEFQRDDGVRHQIVGVVANSYYGDLHHGPEPAAYIPMKPARHFTLYVRSTLPPSSLVRLVERETKAIGLSNHVFETTTLQALVGNTLLKEKMLAGVGGAFAFLGLQLAAMGLFGLLNYSVGQRTKEIGIRAALGARRGQLLLLVMKDLLMMAGLGLLAGILGSLLVMTAVRSLLFGIGIADPRVFATASLVFLAAMLLAGSLPAIHAMNVDPILSLRHD